MVFPCPCSCAARLHHYAGSWCDWETSGGAVRQTSCPAVIETACVQSRDEAI